MTNINDELREMCNGYREDLERLYNAEYTDEERERMEEDGEPCDLWEYFRDALDVEYTISARGQYLGCRIAVALGGPSIYIDTREKEIHGYWGTDRAEIWLPYEICDEIDDIFEELYSCMK